MENNFPKSVFLKIIEKIGYFWGLISSKNLRFLTVELVGIGRT